MAKMKKSLAERTRRWKHISEQQESLLTDLPHAKEEVAELRQLTEDISLLIAQYTYHLAQTRTLTARIRALAKRADTIRGRVGAALRGEFGFDSTELIRYGFTPRKAVKKDHTDRELEREREEAKEDGVPS